jgi:NAD(P)-dependent dehydrogenase (short-subunit alcohol dehydrogenase family)
VISQPLTGRTALITGAGRGLGREIALAYGAAGASLALVARTAGEIGSVADEVSRLGVRAVPFPADVSVESDVRQIVLHALDAFGPVDILVNNAGITPGAADGPIGSVLDVDTEFWDLTFAINCRGPFLMIRELLPAMLDQRRGCIIGITSKVASKALVANAPYGPSKAAFEMLTRIVDTEFADRGLRANLLHPGGPVATTVFNEQYQPFSGELAPPSVIRDAAVWLASDAAAGVHGEIIDARRWNEEHAMSAGV